MYLLSHTTKIKINSKKATAQEVQLSKWKCFDSYKKVLISHKSPRCHHLPSIVIKRNQDQGQFQTFSNSQLYFEHQLNSNPKKMNLQQDSPNKEIYHQQYSIQILTKPHEAKVVGLEDIKEEEAPQKDQAKEGVKDEQIKSPDRLKSVCREIIIGLIMSLSAISYGISLKEITAIPMSELVIHYNIPINKFTAQSILIGILPFGAVFGVLITKALISRYRRLVGIYIFTVINVGAMVLVNITTFQTFIVGRFIEGICIGYYTNICPIYLKEIAPKELRRMLGLFFSLGKIVGVLIAIFLELIFDKATFEWSWRILLSLTGFFSVLQAILIFFFGSDTPTEMIEKGNEPQALKIIEKFYKREFVEQILKEYKKEYEMEMAKGKQTVSQDLNPKERSQIYKQYPYKNIEMQKFQTQMHIQSQPQIGNFLKNRLADPLETQKAIEQKPQQLTYEQKKNYAYWMGLHLCVIRHWLAGNLIITQGGQFIGTFDKNLGHYTSLIINLVQFVFVVLGLIWFQKIVGKRPMFLFSVSLLSIINIALGIAMMEYNPTASLIIMIIYMIIYGGSFISPIWSYPSQVIPASQSVIPNIVHWTALALEILIPPLLAGSMPNNNAYPVFFFFGVYGIFGFIHVFRCLRQTDGLMFNQIIKSYK